MRLLLHALAVFCVCCDRQKLRDPDGHRQVVQLSLCGSVAARSLARCGRVFVPENRDHIGGRRISLNVMLLPARNRSSPESPIVFLTGGPGLAATEYSGYVLRAVGDLRNRHDILLLDQRGTGHSHPLQCDLAGDSRSLQSYLDPSFRPSRVRQCAGQLSAVADLASYTTTAAADDLADVLTALNYRRIDIFAVSYGTRVALTFLRRHPEFVRRAVLLSATPPGKPIPSAAARAGAHALFSAFRACAASPSCRTAVPDPDRDFQAVITHLKRTPARITLWNWERISKERLTLTERAFAERAWDMLYDPGRARRLLLVTHSAAAGDWSPFIRAAIAARRASNGDRSNGATLSILCSEDAPALSTLDTAGLAMASPLGLPIVQEIVAACSQWPRAHTRPVSSATAPMPTSAAVLFISGALDPVTPVDWADSAAAVIPNRIEIVDQSAGHAPLTRCTVMALRSFLDSGAIRGARMSSACVLRTHKRTDTPAQME